MQPKPLNQQYFFGVGLRSMAFQLWIIGMPLYFQESVGPLSEFSEALVLSTLGCGLGMLLAFSGRKATDPARRGRFFDLLQLTAITLYFLSISLSSTCNFWLLTGLLFVIQVCYGAWLVTNEATVSTCVKESGSVKLFHNNFTAVMLGGFIGAVAAEFIYKAGGLHIFFGIFGALVLISYWLQRPFLGQVSWSGFNREKSRGGLQCILASRALLNMTLFGVCNRVLIMGMIPFAAYIVNSRATGQGYVTLIIGLFQLGLILGGLRIVCKRFSRRLKHPFAVLVGSIVVLGATIAFGLKLELGFYLVGTLLFALGVLVARNAIPMRALRILVTDREAISSVVGVQSLCFYFASPLSGIVLGAFFSEGYQVMGVSGLLLAYVAFVLAACGYIRQMHLGFSDNLMGLEPSNKKP